MWVEDEGEGVDQALSRFRAARSVFNVETEQWEPMRGSDDPGQVHHLVVRHRMEPVPGHDLIFSLRDPSDPVRRVHPDYADAEGLVASAVEVRTVGSRSGRHERFVDEVTEELKGLIKNSRAGARPRETFASTRIRTRVITEADGLPPHEQVLIGKYGTFVPPEVPADQIRAADGHILGIYMGALMRSRADREFVQDRYHGGVSEYLMLTDVNRWGPGISGLGATNSIAFANTALLGGVGPSAYDPDRINAEFLHFHAEMTLANGRRRRETIAVLVGTSRLHPGQQILVDYGPQYLEEFDQRNQPPTPEPHIKHEPHD
jgi:hypothetical protein